MRKKYCEVIISIINKIRLLSIYKLYLRLLSKFGYFRKIFLRKNNTLTTFLIILDSNVPFNKYSNK